MMLATLMAVVKLAVESGVAFPEVLFWRQVPTVFLIGGWLATRGQLGRLRTKRLPIHFRRAMLGMTGMIFTFGAPVLLPLTEATTLGFTTPIFAVILSALLLKERVGPVRWLAVALGFAGVLIITHPGHSDIPVLGAAVGLPFLLGERIFTPTALVCVMLLGVFQLLRWLTAGGAQLIRFFVSDRKQASPGAKVGRLIARSTRRR